MMNRIKHKNINNNHESSLFAYLQCGLSYPVVRWSVFSAVHPGVKVRVVFSAVTAQLEPDVLITSVVGNVVHYQFQTCGRHRLLLHSKRPQHYQIFAINPFLIDAKGFRLDLCSPMLCMLASRSSKSAMVPKRGSISLKSSTS